MGLLSWLTSRRRRQKPRRRWRRRSGNGVASGLRTSVLSEGDTEYFSLDDAELETCIGSPRRNSSALDSSLSRQSSHSVLADAIEEDGVLRSGELVIVHSVDSATSKGNDCASVVPTSHGTDNWLFRVSKPHAGSSLKLLSSKEQGGHESAVGNIWGKADATSFKVRGVDYAKTKRKVSSLAPLYEVLSVDIFMTDFKLAHVARHVELPPVPNISQEAIDRGYPPLLIVNLQVPLYNPGYFGPNDGKGVSLVYYFNLPENWSPNMIEQPAARELVESFFNDSLCADGTPARDRLKLIPRVVNVDEWAAVSSLSHAERALLTRYNDKPVLTRPQHAFYHGRGYLEVDLDAHHWNFLARKAFFGYIPKLSKVVFENAFVVQGNTWEELPEQVLACVRVSKADFDNLPPFPLKHDELSHEA